MHTVMEASDRKILMATAAVLVILVGAILFVAPTPEEDVEEVPSSYSGNSGGAWAAFLLLRELGYDVIHWEEWPGELPSDPSHIVLILANPEIPPGEKERAELKRFVERGGRVLFTGPEIGLFFSDAKIETHYGKRQWQTYSADVPSLFTKGAPKIAMRPQAHWAMKSSSQVPLYGDPDAPVIVSWRIGKGRVLWWAEPTPLTNSGITREGNLALFLDAVSFADSKDPADIVICWDEYFHGERGSLWAYVQKTPVPWGLVQLTLLGLAVFFTFGRRSGPIIMPTRVNRLSPLEFVDTLGGLYQRARASPAAVAVIYQQLRRALKLKWALPANASGALVEEKASQRLGWRESGIAAMLERARTASEARKLAPSDALQAIRELEDLERKLGLKPTKFQENN